MRHRQNLCTAKATRLLQVSLAEPLCCISASGLRSLMLAIFLKSARGMCMFLDSMSQGVEVGFSQSINPSCGNASRGVLLPARFVRISQKHSFFPGAQRCKLLRPHLNTGLLRAMLRRQPAEREANQARSCLDRLSRLEGSVNSQLFFAKLSPARRLSPDHRTEPRSWNE